MGNENKGGLERTLIRYAFISRKFKDGKKNVNVQRGEAEGISRHCLMEAKVKVKT